MAVHLSEVLQVPPPGSGAELGGDGVCEGLLREARALWALCCTLGLLRMLSFAPLRGGHRCTWWGLHSTNGLFRMLLLAPLPEGGPLRVKHGMLKVTLKAHPKSKVAGGSWSNWQSPRRGVRQSPRRGV